MNSAHAFVDNWDKNAEAAQALWEPWLAFVYHQLARRSGETPMTREAFAEAIADPYFSDQAHNLSVGQTLVDWVRQTRHRGIDKSDTDAWTAWLETLAEPHAFLHIKALRSTTGLVASPFFDVKAMLQIYKKYDIAKPYTGYLCFRDFDLLTAQEREEHALPHVLCKLPKTADAFIESILADYVGYESLSGICESDVLGLWNQGALSASFWASIANAHGVARKASQLRLLSEVEFSKGAYHLTEALAGVVYESDDPQTWQARWERMLILLAPLFGPGELTTIMTFTERNVPRSIPQWYPKHESILTRVGEELATGEGIWKHANDAMVASAADVSALQALQWRGDVQQLLIHCRRNHVSAFVAGLGHLKHRNDPKWWIDCYFDIGKTGQSGGYVAAVLRPFVEQLRQKPDLTTKHLRALEDREVAFLWQYYCLCDAVLADETLFNQTIVEGDLTLYATPPDVAQAYPNRWLRFAQAMFKKHGRINDSGVRTEEVIDWYRTIVPELGGQERQKIVSAIASTQTQDERLDFLLRQYETTSPPYDVFKGFDEPASLYPILGQANEALAERAGSHIVSTWATRLREHGESDGLPPGWTEYLAQTQAHADFLGTTYRSRPNATEIRRWRLVWTHAKKPETRPGLAKAVLEQLSRGNQEATLIGLANELLGDDRQPFDHACDEFYERNVLALNNALSQAGGELLRFVPSLCLKQLGQSTWFGDEREPLDERPLQAALTRFPDALAKLNDKEQVKLLPYFDESCLVSCASVLSEGIQSTKLKAYAYELAALMGRSSADAIDQSGLLEVKAKKVKLAVNHGLGLNDSPAVSDWIHARIRDKANTDQIRDLMLDRLEAFGEDVSTLDPWHNVSDDELAAQSHKFRVPKAIKDLWNPALADAFAHIDESLALMTLGIVAAHPEDSLPRRSRQIFEKVSPAQRQDLAAEACNIWVAENGAEKASFLMRVVSEFGDERAADTLGKAVNAWCKKRKQKANQATRWLSRMRGTYPLTKAKAVFENRKFSDSLIRTARDALQDVAAGRGMEFHDLMDQLVPDFGMDESGLTLDVGPYHYAVKVMPDLSLRVIHSETGKSTKSLPKAKASEDDDLRGLADNQFKALRKGLRPLAKDQVKKLGRAVLGAKSWRRDVWSSLYLEHPVLRLLGQGVLWTGVGPDDSPVTHFRPTEDGALLNASDEAVSLEDIVRVRVTHPVDLSDDELASWRQHMEDFEIDSPFDQLGLSTRVPEHDEIEDAKYIVCNRGHVLPRTSFTSVLERYGYTRGSTEDGGRIYDHIWRVGEFRVTAGHSGMSAWFDESEKVALNCFYVVGKRTDGNEEVLSVEAIPKALQAAIVQQAEELAAKGSGFDPKWRGL
ncbi:MAG: DUF4132 domain-containing protein [Pseudomonadota bacterium]